MCRLAVTTIPCLATRPTYWDARARLCDARAAFPQLGEDTLAGVARAVRRRQRKRNLPLLAAGDAAAVQQLAGRQAGPAEPISRQLGQPGNLTAGNRPAMLSVRANDRLSFAMICIMSAASIGGVLLMSAGRKQAKAQRPASIDNVEERLKIFDRKPER